MCVCENSSILLVRLVRPARLARLARSARSARLVQFGWAWLRVRLSGWLLGLFGCTVWLHSLVVEFGCKLQDEAR